ncbi:hypothetical protein Tco_0529655 [Tanacetum coccineum]
MEAKKVKSLKADLEQFHEEVKANLAALGNKLDTKVDALRMRQELEDRRYEEVKNMLLSLTNKDTSKLVEPLKKVQVGLKFDDLDDEVDEKRSITEPPSLKQAMKTAMTLNNFLLRYEKTKQEVLIMIRKMKDDVQGEVDFNKI